MKNNRCKITSIVLLLIISVLLIYRGYSPGIKDIVSTTSTTCDILAIAFDEGQFAPAWYTEAGLILNKCGYDNAIDLGEYKACSTERMMDNTKVCSEPSHLILK